MGQTTEFDAAHHLDSDLLLLAISNAAKAKGMVQIARDTGLGREGLYKALATGID